MNQASPLWSKFQEFFSDPVVQVVVGLVGLVSVSLIAFYGLSRLRRINAHNLQIDALVKRNFEEMRSGGVLDDQEFRKIEALLANKTKSDKPPRSAFDGSSES